MQKPGTNAKARGRFQGTPDAGQSIAAGGGAQTLGWASWKNRSSGQSPNQGTSRTGRAPEADLTENDYDYSTLKARLYMWISCLMLEAT
jgi:hypothetical protein